LCNNGLRSWWLSHAAKCYSCIYIVAYIWFLTDHSSSEDELELWNKSCPDSEYESDHDSKNKEPDLPHFDPEADHSEILSKWFMRFILILLGKFYLPEKCIDFLLNFLYVFLSVIGNFPRENIMLLLPPSLQILKKKLGLANEFRKCTVCQRYLSI